MPSPILQLLLKQAEAENSNDALGPSRRQAKLELARRFWALSAQEKASLHQLSTGSIDLNNQTSLSSDPFDLEPADQPSQLVSKRGIIIRTDFTNEAAWSEFVDTVTRSEKDGLEDLRDGKTEAEEGNSSITKGNGEQEASDEDEEEEGDVEMEAADSNANGASGSSESDENDANCIVLEAFILLSSPPADRDRLKDASNIALLRLLTDVNIIPSSQGAASSTSIDAQFNVPPPKPPPGVKSPIIGIDGFVESYEGPTIWVYDTLSNQDGSLRCVALRPQQGQYGVTTADSWRAKGRSVWDLQLNLDAETLTIDFVPEANERTRNLRESTI